MSPIVVLALIEQDVRLIRKLCQIADASLIIRIARRSAEVILYLRGVGVYADRSAYPLPDLILLDTENPDSSDLIVLSWLRDQKAFGSTPIGFLASLQGRNLHAACAIDANCFIVDRENLADLSSLARFALQFPTASPRWPITPPAAPGAVSSL